MKRQKRNEKICVTCGKPFYVKPSKDDWVKNCSLECRRNAPIKKQKEKELEKMKKATELAARHELTPMQSSQIRGQIASFVRNQIEIANNVVIGAVDWNPTQARVFGMLLNKVVPDLSASYVQHEHNNKDVIDMSRDELERIAAGIDAIDVTEDTNEDSK